MSIHLSVSLEDNTLVAAVEAKAAQARAFLADAIARHGPLVLANSFGAEDMVLTHLIHKAGLAVSHFTLDTGRLPEETYALMARVQKEYGIPIHLFHPEAEAVERYARENGVNGFYDSVEKRRLCCRIRKLDPLTRALVGQKAWVTGLRAAQSVTREGLAPEVFDEDHGLYKLAPLAEWDEREVWVYLRHHEVPFNALHTRFYPSIGCAPCTRAISPGEDLRAGRWWWENPESKECGLHARH
jgi:phosphoadenosine phosphosulfate reductase